MIKKKKKGVHAFLITIRDEQHIPLPGLKIGEVGSKKKFHGMDNDFIHFSDFRVSKDALLDRFTSINEKGEYQTAVKDPNRLLSLALSSFIGGRLAFARFSSENALRAITIALRYGAYRRQFALSSKGPETVLLDYRIHQYRLIPRFAEALIHFVATSSLVNSWSQENLSSDAWLDEKRESFLEK